MKTAIRTAFGAVCATISSALGGWDASLSTLCIFMLADYITGIVVAGVFHNSLKTPTGSLKSLVGFQGLCRKGVTLLFVLVGHRIDVTLGINLVREGVIFGFLANETLSLIENAGLMGIPLPDIIVKSVDMLSSKSSDITMTS